MVRILLALLAVFALPLQAATCDLLSPTRIEVAPEVLLFQSPEGTTGIVNGNTVEVFGRDGVLVFDAGQFPSVADTVIGEIRARTRAPVKVLVNSHWHGDHLLANATYRAAWPDVKIVAHPHTIAEAARRYTADYAAKTKADITRVQDFYRKKYQATSDDEREWIDRTFACVDATEADVARTQPIAPDTPVTDRMDVDLGGITVSIRHLGSGNTPGDVVAWLPAQRIVATGDILVHPAPYALGSNLKPWPATLDRVLALDPAVVLPGHGPVMRDTGYLRDVRALVASTQRQVEALLAAGVPKAEAFAKLDTRAFAERHVRTAMQRQAFDKFFVRAAVEAAWPKAPTAAPAQDTH